MKFKTNIPGQVSESQLKAIATIAANLKDGSTIVEVGSLFGRSSWVWAQNCPEDSVVYCIDPWEGNEGIKPMEERFGIKYSKQQFLEFTSDCKNIRAIKGYSPKVAKDWANPVNVYYEDAVHSNPVLHKNLAFWSSFVPPSGIICGDDYRPRFPDVVNEVNELANRRECELLKIEFFWCLLPKNGRTEQQQTIYEKLKALQKEFEVSQQTRQNAHTIEILDMPANIKSGLNKVTVRITNDSGQDWSVEDIAQKMIALHFAADGSDINPQFLAALDLRKLPYDLSETTSVEFLLPATTKASTYTPTVRLVGIDGKTLGPGRRHCNQATVEIKH